MIRSLFFSLFLLTCVTKSRSQAALDIESGFATFGYNNIRIPGNTGSLFSITNKGFYAASSLFIRMRLNYTIARRHTISALYAPLILHSSGMSAQDITFQNTVFTAGSLVNVTWKFNSYRLGYRYAIVAKERITFALGLTGKIRDAKIALLNKDTTAEKTNLGFVPLIRFYLDWRFSPRFKLLVDGDALVGKQGRAEDVLVGIGFNATDDLTVKAGCRLLEGGADNDEVYNFSSVHYAAVGLIYVFPGNAGK